MSKMPEKSIALPWDEIEEGFKSGRMQLRERPNFPSIKFRNNSTGVEYELTDVRYLDKTGVNILLNIVNAATKDRDMTEARFKVGADWTDDEIWIASDIASGFSYKASKKGRYGWLCEGTFLVMGYAITGKEDDREITYSLASDHVKFIYDYSKNKIKTTKSGEKELEINVADIVVRYVDSLHE